ncbi:hypothetical protein ACQR1Y_11500 [Bradyrhizobium sp. HKCCYLRH3099]|uniref:hypothetical protein n=1 Tax=unclassified Bradyrhizobium TaxID=2631580 RepID=UPI003EB6B424
MAIPQIKFDAGFAGKWNLPSPGQAAQLHCERNVPMSFAQMVGEWMCTGVMGVAGDVGAAVVSSGGTGGTLNSRKAVAAESGGDQLIYMKESDLFRENADNCLQLAEHAQGEPAYRRFRRMAQGWSALALQQDWLDGEIAPIERGAVGRRDR